jgi:hypothetical protein
MRSVGLDLTKLERMTAEDIDTAVRRYLLEPIDLTPGRAPTAADVMNARAHLVTTLRERKLWPASVRAGR